MSLLGIGSLFSITYAASTIISDSGITTPNLTVTGTCAGCSGEGDFSSYSLITNKTDTSGPFSAGIYVQVGNDKSVIGFENGGKTMYFNPSGNLISSTSNSSPIAGPYPFEQSLTGKYRIIRNDTSSQIDVYKNNILLTHIPIDITHSFESYLFTTCGISQDGKYIALFGPDFTTNFEQLQVWQGS